MVHVTAPAHRSSTDEPQSNTEQPSTPDAHAVAAANADAGEAAEERQAGRTSGATGKQRVALRTAVTAAVTFGAEEALLSARNAGLAAVAAALPRFPNPVAAALTDLRLDVVRELVPSTAIIERAIAPTRLLGPSLSWQRTVEAMMPKLRWPQIMFPATTWLAGYNQPWWTELDLWPTDGLLTSLLRPLDVVRPQLRDLTSAVDGLLGAQAWIGTTWFEPFGAVFEQLRTAGARLAYYAVHRARAALEDHTLTDWRRGHPPELVFFCRAWLDLRADEPRLEALTEALLAVDLAGYAPEDGHLLLAAVRRRTLRGTPGRRRESESLLGLHRRGATIIPLGDHDDVTALRRPGMPAELTIEDHVLDRIQPEIDPRLIEQFKDAPLDDQKIMVIKAVLGLSWTAAAQAWGWPAARGEVLRQRVQRHAAKLPAATDPWALPDGRSSVHRVGFGRLPSFAADLDTDGVWS